MEENYSKSLNDRALNFINENKKNGIKIGRIRLARYLGVNEKKARNILDTFKIFGIIKDDCNNQTEKKDNKKKANSNKKNDNSNLDSKITIKETKNSQEVSGNFKSLEELIEKCNIDLSIWECYDYAITNGEWDVASKSRDQKLTWKIKDDNKGNPIQLMEGYSNRANEFVTQKNKKFNISAKFRLKKTIIYKDTFKEELIEDIKRNIELINLSKDIKQKTFYINKNETSFCLEISRFDLHFGKLIWGEETGGTNYDSKIAKELYLESGQYLMNEAKRICKIDKILLPLGNDFFNSDNNLPFPTTTNGTAQQDDLRWQKTFRQGRQLITDDINYLNQFAPIDMKMIQGNHDTQKSFYLGDALECLFLHNKNVNIDNNANYQKYWSYGNLLLGFTHDSSNLHRLTTTMQFDRPDLWFNSKFREWHLGHIHHTKKLEILTEEDMQGITVRFLRTLMPTDGWENAQKYKSNKGAEGFIWSKDKGLYHHIPFNI